MDYCKYHPLAPATHHCSYCLTDRCDRCTDEGDSGHDQNCFSCQRPMEALGAVNNVTPYWRRLQESFRYPLNSNAIALIIGVSVFSTIGTFFPFPFGVVILLGMTGILLKYCFTCMESTAHGLLVAPDIREAYNGGIAIVGALLFILFVVSSAIGGAYVYLGPQIAGLITLLLVLCLPAVVIIYGMTDNLFEALNPINILDFVRNTGLAYGLLLAFIMIMSSSVGVISVLIGGEFTFFSTILESIVTNYYMIVTFHIMGYMIFQYQGSLGFAARENRGEGNAPRSPRDRLVVNIDVALKDGEYNKVVTLFDSALKTFPNDKEFNKLYFEFLFATRRLQVIDQAASRYLAYLIKSRQEHQLTLIYKRVLQLNPKYMPDTPKLRFELGRVCHETGDPKSTVRLINGLHKQFPDYPKLADAFELMAAALEDIPHQQAQAQQCKALAQRLAERQEQLERTKAAATQKAQPVATPTGAKKPTGKKLGPTGPVQAPTNLSLVPMDGEIVEDHHAD